MTRAPRPYADPYLAGAALGAVLLAAFVIVGRGLGASGAFAATAAGLSHAIAPAHTEANPYFARYLDGDGPWRDWLVFELGGVALGGFVAAWAAGRLRGEVERGPVAGCLGRAVGAVRLSLGLANHRGDVARAVARSLRRSPPGHAA